MVQAHVEGIDVGQEGDQGPLLELVPQYGGVPLARLAHAQPGAGVPYGVGHGYLLGAHAHGGHAQPAAQELVGQDQEALPTLGDRAGEGAVLAHLGHLVQEGLPGHPHMIQPQGTIVHTVGCHLVSHVPDISGKAERWGGGKTCSTDRSAVLGY